MLRIQIVCFVAVILLSTGACFAAESTPSPNPGPESAGLRLRFVVESRRADSVDEFHVRVDLINVTDEPIKVSGDWPNHMKGSFQEYMEGATSIRTYPDITQWGIQVMAPQQPVPKAEHILASGETLSVKWTTKGRRLKNRVIHPLSTRNPSFPSDGLYGVHAELLLKIESGTETGEAKRKEPTGREEESGRRLVLLRSNEQLVSVGGSNRAPKTAIAGVQHVSDDFKTAQIDVGTVEGIEPGDEFLARTGMSTLWKLTVTESRIGYSTASVKLEGFGASRPAPPRDHELLKPSAAIGLIPAGAKNKDWMWGHR